MTAAHQSRGFTLLEIMVAMMILATISTVIMGSFQQTFDVRDHNHRVFERYKDVRMGMHRMARELSMAYLSVHHHAQEPHSSTWFLGKEDQVQFTSFANLRMVRDVDESDQAEIGYFIERGESSDGRRVENLVRRIDPTPDEEPLKGGFKYVMVEDVRSIELEYWDPEKELGEDGWVDDWEAGKKPDEDAENGMLLPERVRITLKVNGTDGSELSFVTQTTIMVTKPLDF